MTRDRRVPILIAGLAALAVASAIIWFTLVRPIDDSVGSGPDGLSVQRLHHAFFDRPPEDPGLSLWTARFAHGEDIEVLAEEFTHSPEFTDTYGSLSDAEFVDLAYRNILDRPPEDGEQREWTRALQGGASRGHLMAELSDSAEHKVLTGWHTHDTRVLLIGDSLMDESGPYAEQRLRELGYTTLLDARPGSGLLASHRPVDWHAEMRALVESFDPHIVVVEFCCNHWPDRQPEGHPYRDIEWNTPEFYEAWEQAVDEAVEILTSRGARLAWVHTPPASDPLINAIIDGLNEISAEAGMRHGFARIDWAVAISDGAFRLDWGGDTVRNPDGLHFEEAGARRTATATVAGVMRVSMTG